VLRRPTMDLADKDDLVCARRRFQRAHSVCRGRSVGFVIVAAGPARTEASREDDRERESEGGKHDPPADHGPQGSSQSKVKTGCAGVSSCAAPLPSGWITQSEIGPVSAWRLKVSRPSGAQAGWDS
jgi:hypothetical protein